MLQYYSTVIIINPNLNLNSHQPDVIHKYRVPLTSGKAASYMVSDTQKQLTRAASDVGKIFIHFKRRKLIG